MNALRQAHTALVPDGILLDLHPYTAALPVERNGVLLGELDTTEFARDVEAMEKALEQCIDRGWFSRESERRFDVLEHFATADALIENVSDWDRTRIPRGLRTTLRRSRPPFQVREPVLLSRLRA